MLTTVALAIAVSTAVHDPRCGYVDPDIKYIEHVGGDKVMHFEDYYLLCIDGNCFYIVDQPDEGGELVIGGNQNDSKDVDFSIQYDGSSSDSFDGRCSVVPASELVNYPDDEYYIWNTTDENYYTVAPRCLYL